MATADDRLLVSTQCPSCGAPLDFGEGTNCVACPYCRSRLLVTGRGQTLAYTVTTRVDGREAFAIARFAEPGGGGPFRCGEPLLFFLPYYRFRALELRWQRPEPTPRPLEVEEPVRSGDYQPAISIEAVLADLAPGPEDVEFHERHIEKNFLAIELPAIELLSLGLRATVLKLSLFGRGALEARGTVVAPQMSSAAAVERGERLIEGHNVARRALVGRQLSLVYFPFWFVPVDRPGRRTVTVVDAVSQAIVLRDGDADWMQRLRAEGGGERTLGFRPLRCPNCGWDLALRPDDVIFYCTSCFRAWQIAAEELVGVAHRVAEPPRGDVPHLGDFIDDGLRGPASVADEVTTVRNVPFLPLWSLRGAIGGDPLRRFLAPAFQCRRLKTLADLAARLSRIEPELVASERLPEAAHGAYLDQRDAAELALFAEVGGGAERFDEVAARAGETLRVDESELVWVPFGADAYSYLDPFTGAAIPKNLLP